MLNNLTKNQNGISANACCEVQDHFTIQTNHQRYNPYTLENLSEGEFLEMANRRKLGEGSVFFNEVRKKWQVAFSLGIDDTGKRKRKIISAETEADAWRAYNDFINVAQKPQSMESLQSENMTFEEVYNRYLNSVHKGSERAFGNKVLLSKILIEKFGSIAMCDLTQEKIQIGINELSNATYCVSKKTQEKRYYSKVYLDKIFSQLCQALKFAIKSKWLDRDFLEGIEPPVSRQYKEGEEQELSPEEIKTILSGLKNKKMLYTIILIMVYTGIRPGEAFALKWSDCNFTARTLNIIRALSLTQENDIEGKKCFHHEPVVKGVKCEKGGEVNNTARRTLAVSDFVLAAIKDWENTVKSNDELMRMKKANGTLEFMFVKPSDGKLPTPDYFGQEYRKELERNGINGQTYNMYRFRHTFCTRQLKFLHKDTGTVQKLMGHNSPDMVLKVYYHINQMDMLAAGEDFSIDMDNIIAI